jgi:Protein of unknown function (DUF2793)
MLGILEPLPGQTLTVAAGATAFGVANMIWSLADARPGDELSAAGFSVPVRSFDAATGNGVLLYGWPGAAVTGSLGWAVKQSPATRINLAASAEQAATANAWQARIMGQATPWTVLTIANAPPASPVANETHLAGPTASGGFSPNLIYRWLNGGWVPIQPRKGDFAFVVTTKQFLGWDGSVWGVASAVDSDMPAARIKGRVTAGTGAPENLTAAQVRSMLSLPAPGAALPVADGGTGAATPAGARKNLGLDDTTTAPNVGDTWSWNGTIWVPGRATGGRPTLTANRTYYVRSDGNDSNDGLTNSAGGAFLTIQKAIDVSVTLDLSAYSVTIRCGAGTRSQTIVLKSYIGVGPIILEGDVTTPANVLISVTNGDCVQADTVIGKWRVRGFKFQTATAGSLFSISNGSVVEYDTCDFGLAAGGSAQLYISSSAIVTAVGNYTISASGYSHWTAIDGGKVTCRNRVVTITGTPAFGSAFAIATRGGGVMAIGTTYSGSATGGRFRAEMNGTIDFGGTTPPGSVAGSSSTGGQFA